MTAELKSFFGDSIKDNRSIQPQQSQLLNFPETNKKDSSKDTLTKKTELIKIIGGIPPMKIQNHPKNFKSKSKWVWTTFTNPSRSDNFELYHWQKSEDINLYSNFEKYANKKEIVEFTKEEYDTLIKPNDRNWNYEQTLYLWELLNRFDMRFQIVYDRFDEMTYGERTIESLKDRYYSVARLILENRKMYDHPIVKHPFNYEKEMKRKNFLEKSMNKNNDELREEENILAKAEVLNKFMEKIENIEKSKNQEVSQIILTSDSDTNILYNNNSRSVNETNYLDNNNINNSTIQNQTAAFVADYNFNYNNNTMINSNNNINIEDNNKIYQNNNNENLQKNNNNKFSYFEEYLQKGLSNNISFVYLRSEKLKPELEVSNKIKIQLDNFTKDIKERPVPTKNVQNAYFNYYKNILLYCKLKKNLEIKDNEFKFLSGKLKEFQNKKNPSNNNGNNSNHQGIKSQINKQEKNSNLINKINNSKIVSTQEINSQDIPQENSAIIANTNLNLNNNNKNNINVVQNINNTTNAIITNQSTAALAGPKTAPPKEKRKKINTMQKVRKRKNANEEESQANEEKEQKLPGTKKKKKATK